MPVIITDLSFKKKCLSNSIQFSSVGKRELCYILQFLPFLLKYLKNMAVTTCFVMYLAHTLNLLLTLFLENWYSSKINERLLPTFHFPVLKFTHICKNWLKVAADRYLYRYSNYCISNEKLYYICICTFEKYYHNSHHLKNW